VWPGGGMGFAVYLLMKAFKGPLGVGYRGLLVHARTVCGYCGGLYDFTKKSPPGIGYLRIKG
jgi:hypothetical protein